MQRIPRSEEATRHHLNFTAAGHKLLNPFAATLDQDDQHDDRKDSGYDSNDCYIVHVNSPFSMNEVLVKTLYLKYLSKLSITVMAAGPSVTRNSEGKIKNTSGKTSLTVVFAAISSTAWRR
jgi:hypothetical protein